MADMWIRFLAVAPLFLQRLDLQQIRKPVSETDGRATALDLAALMGIESALDDQPTFLAQTEAVSVFAAFMNRQHLCLTGRGCHDYI